MTKQEEEKTNCVETDEMTGTVSSVSSFAASYRVWPQRIMCSALTMIGCVKPNSSMERFTAAIPFLFFRGFFA